MPNDTARITLKNVRIAKNLSEETLAFTADVYLDGTKIAYARNDGHGGSTLVMNYEGKFDALREASDIVRALPPVETDLPDPAAPVGSDAKFSYDQTIDTFVDGLAARHEVEKELKRKLKRNPLFVKPDAPDAVMQMSVPRGRTLVDGLAYIRETRPEWTLLQDMPFDKALNLYTGGA